MFKGGGGNQSYLHIFKELLLIYDSYYKCIKIMLYFTSPLPFYIYFVFYFIQFENNASDTLNPNGTSDDAVEDEFAEPQNKSVLGGKEDESDFDSNLERGNYQLLFIFIFITFMQRW